jgi:excisionase family DNA binding protein
LKTCEFYDIIKSLYIQGEAKMPDKNNMPDRWYSTKEICAYLGISRDTMLAWITKKNMPAHKVGRNWMFKTSEIDEWVKSGQAEDKN